jgi:hypothetical protein
MADYTELSRQLISHEDAQALAIEGEIERYQEPWSWFDWSVPYLPTAGIAVGELFIPRDCVVHRVQDEFIVEIIKDRRHV